LANHCPTLVNRWLTVAQLICAAREVTLPLLIADFNETWHICRAVENNRYVFFYICNGASLRVTTIPYIYKYEY